MDSQLGAPASVLLVEDNPGDVRLTQEAFEEAQIEITLDVVNDGKEALDYLYQRSEDAAATLPDLVLLDLNLPKKNGEKVLAEIRNDPALARVPVVILTSSDAEEDIVQSYDLDANAYLTKPIDPDQFVEQIRTLEQFWLRVVRLPPDE